MAKGSKKTTAPKAPAKPRKRAQVNTSLASPEQSPIVAAPPVITQDRGRKAETMRRPKVLQDQILNYRPAAIQGNLFDSLLNETQRKIMKDGHTDPTTIKIVGIELTKSQHRMVDALNLLLHRKSTNIHNQEDEATFYAGNTDGDHLPELKFYGGKGQSAMSPVLHFWPGELYEAYHGSKSYSGRDIEHIKSVFNTLAEKQFLVQYTRRITGTNGQEVVQEIEEYQPLFRIGYYSESSKMSEGEVAQKREGVLIRLSPIFKDGIHKEYIEFPVDIVSRTIIAAGGPQYPECVNLLRDYLIRDLGVNPKGVREVNYDTLLSIMKLDNYVREGRRKLANQNAEKAIRIVQALELVLKVEHTKGDAGQPKVIFHLNRDFLLAK